MLETAISSRRTVGVVGGLLAPHTLLGRFVRYAFASATGTVVDLAAFALLVAGGVGAGSAAALGYALGTLWHWQIASRFVFADRMATDFEARSRQQWLFIASAVLGLSLTTAIVSLGVSIGFDPSAAKIAAMCTAFTSVWLVRLLFVFAEERG